MRRLFVSDAPLFGGNDSLLKKCASLFFFTITSPWKRRVNDNPRFARFVRPLVSLRPLRFTKGVASRDQRRRFARGSKAKIYQEMVITWYRWNGSLSIYAIYDFSRLSFPIPQFHKKRIPFLLVRGSLHLWSREATPLVKRSGRVVPLPPVEGSLGTYFR